MGFKQRERKRKQKAAIRSSMKVDVEARKARSGRWWLTVVKTDTCCARCAGILRTSREMVYRAQPREALCVACAEADPEVTYRPSLAWEERRRDVSRGR
jgi:hypothetical protein